MNNCGGIVERDFKSTELVNTYSIIAFDPEAGLMGGAVQSHYFSVGGTVIWAKPGAGVIATQAMVNMDYGPEGLVLLSRGMKAADVINSLTAADDAAEVRQAAAIDCSGAAAAFTGKKTISEAGHVTGRGFSTQANMMLNKGVAEAMAAAFIRTAGSLAERLLVALKAAQSAGGDIRGMQSAAMLIVPVEEQGSVRDNIITDLRVEDNEAPLDELERLLSIEKAYRHSDLGDLALEKGDLTAAMKEYSKAERIQPDNIELIFWKAVSLFNNRMFEEAEADFIRVFKRDKNWAELFRRLPAAGIIDTNDSGLKDFIKRITGGD